MEFKRTIVGLGVLVAALLAGLWLYVARPVSDREKTEPPQSLKPIILPRPAHVPRANLPSEQPDPADAEASSTQTNLMERLGRIMNGEFPKISAETIEKYLQEHRRDAGSLLAAWSVSGNPDYLREAATRFPHDPQVQFEVLAHDAFPDDRATWIARYKESSPDDVQAYYFAAHEFFRLNQTEKAIREMLEAKANLGSTSYLVAEIEAREEIYFTAGLSRLEAKAIGLTGQTVPFLQTLRALSKELADTQGAFAAQGDTVNAEKIASLAYRMAQQLNLDIGGRLLINQLVGIAIESKALSQLNPEVTYDWLGVTPDLRLAELQHLRDMIKGLAQGLPTTLTNASEVDMLTYFEMVKSDGELIALQWLTERTKAP